MSTGYTDAVQSGEITNLRDFVIRCLGGSIPPKREPEIGDYDGRVKRAADRLDRLSRMTDAECEAAAEAAYATEMEARRLRETTRAIERCRYEQMLAKVRAWHPPKAWDGIKTFMMTQLTESIEFNCGGETGKRPSRITGAEWRKSQIEYAEYSLERCKEHRASEIAETRERNLNLDALRASLAELE